MFITDFHFDLPTELIAQEPLENRQASRMLVVDRAAAAYYDGAFSGLSSFINKGDVVILNNTKVFPARLIGRSETGAAVETFLVEEVSPNVWVALAKPVKRLSLGKKIHFGDSLSAEVLEKLPDGKIILRYETDGDFNDIVHNIGRTPLPPYIKRDQNVADADRGRYQTIYAKQSGAIAAPTAGLHFTQTVLDELTAAGADIAEVTLHVGYGTFESVRVTDMSEHKVASEKYEIGDEAAAALNKAKADGKRIIAIGTTTTRTLESAIAKHGKFKVEKGLADLTITPGYKFKAVDALLTNFHLPQSSLLVLTSTFGGHELVMNAYRHAVDRQYRFYSYGDCMLII